MSRIKYHPGTGAERTRRKAEARTLVNIDQRKSPRWLLFSDPKASKHRKEQTFDFLMSRRSRQKKKQSFTSMVKAVRKESRKIQVID